MYRFYLNNVINDYHFGELIRIFIPDNAFETVPIVWNYGDVDILGTNSYIVNAEGSEDRDEIKRELYNLLCRLTGREAEWGTLTGVRPLKLAVDLYGKYKSIDRVRAIMSDKYLIADGKLDLLMDILKYQNEHVLPPEDSVALYVGIPFCPTRCEYCSFASNVANPQDIEAYSAKLHEEIKYMGSLMREHNTAVESVYIGGGTPTAFNPEQLDSLITAIEVEMGVKPETIEFTVEAGRPDTIDEDKLSVLRNHGISRISINPQTMKDETLRRIGRRHSSADIENAYNIAGKFDFDVVNADLIAGLPGETAEDFEYSLRRVIELGAENITIHTLSVKRGSRLREEDPEFYRDKDEQVAEMLDISRNMLKSAGFYPYYIYRQKHQIGSFENVGYCTEGKHSLYNIRIMEEKQTVVALGAGGIGKRYFADEDRLERIPNVSNYKIYIERFDEMLERKNRYYGG